TADAMVQGEGVAGLGVAVAGGVLPPEAGAVLDAREVEGAAQEPGAVVVGDLVSEEGQDVGGERVDGRFAQRVELPGGGRVGASVACGRVCGWRRGGAGAVVVGDGVVGDVGAVVQPGSGEELVDGRHGGRGHSRVLGASRRASTVARAWWST